jgi:hypothetical protein
MVRLLQVKDVNGSVFKNKNFICKVLPDQVFTLWKTESVMKQEIFVRTNGNTETVAHREISV